MSKVLRVGIIGTGFGARIQAPVLKTDNRLQLVSLASVSGRHREDGSHGYRVYTDWKSMIDTEELDLVSIASEPKLHYEMTAYAMERGIHVLCEKPMALDANQSAEMIDLRNRTGKLGFIDFEWRFLPARMKVKEILRSGKLGTITHIRYQGNRDNLSTLRTRQLGWQGDRDSGGGILNAVGSHLFDSLLWWTGDDIRSLSSQLNTYVPDVDGSINNEQRTADKSFQVLGAFSSGSTFSAEFISGQRSKMYEWKLEVFGSEGTLVMTDDRQVHLALGNQDFQGLDLPSAVMAPKSLPETAIRFYVPFSQLLDQIYRRIYHLQPNEDAPLFGDGHKVQLVLDAVRRSHQENRRVRVEPSLVN